MGATGKGEKGILVIAEAPGEKEDRRGEQLIGSSGQRLRKALRKVGIDLDRDCRKINAVNCRPPKNRTPTASEVQFCRPMVFEEIKRLKPKIIILLGGTAVESVIGYYWKRDLGGVMKWRGWTIPDRQLNAWVCPTFHPSFVDRMSHIPTAELIFENDLKNALSLLNKPFPSYADERKGVTILSALSEIRTFLKKLYREPPLLFAFDYETTGLKPHAKGHHIVSCSVSYQDGEAYAFLMHDNIVQHLFSKILSDYRSGKIAANMKFEEIWSRFRLNNTRVKNWIWDTMVNEHVLDNRTGITSLKFQSYVRYGLCDYDSHISPYLKAEDSNSFNRIYELDTNELLVYNGVDGIMEFRLAIDQMREAGILDPYSVFQNGFNFPKVKEFNFEESATIEKRMNIINKSKRHAMERT